MSFDKKKKNTKIQKTTGMILTKKNFEYHPF